MSKRTDQSERLANEVAAATEKKLAAMHADVISGIEGEVRDQIVANICEGLDHVNIDPKAEYYEYYFKVLSEVYRFNVRRTVAEKGSSKHPRLTIYDLADWVALNMTPKSNNKCGSFDPPK